MSGPAWWDEMAMQAGSEGHAPWTVDWYRSMRDQYLARFPNADERSKDNMRMFVEREERRAGLVVQGELPLDGS